MAQEPVGPIVSTADGRLRGKVVESARGSTYFSFQGIPYAQPPIGLLRFKAPKQVLPWTGEREALIEGFTAPCFGLATPQYLEESNEDCLYLNVYTKELPADNKVVKKPVMVWIHGGGFFLGSGNTDMYGPDNLLLKDIVLITINYRLGALGFLSLQNEACPGNNGLKDQVEALRWVKRNVSAFGGDPDNVTIFGESAGGAAVQYLMLSPLSRGLFHRAITQSGSVLNSWAYSRHPVECAFKIGEILGFKTDDKDKLLEFLMTVPPRDLVEKSAEVLAAVEPDIYYLDSAFSPVVEPALPGAFISEPLEDLVHEGRFHDVPYILGVNTLEGPIISARKGLQQLNTKEELERLLPIHINLRKGTRLADSTVEKIKSFYFSNGFDEKRCADVLSAVYFLAGNEEVLRGLSNANERKSKTYYYQFTYDAGATFMKKMTGCSEWKGTLHADDIPCLFYMNLFNPTIEPGSRTESVINTMCQLWTDFASTGDPTPETKNWPPYNSTEKKYLEIGEQLKIGAKLNANEMNFWMEIYDDIYGVSPH